MHELLARAAVTRQKILESSRIEFKRNGIEGGSLAGVMSAQGLTIGGFYKYFDSKAHLVSESVALAADQLVVHLARAASEASPQSSYEAIVTTYLAESHRDGEAGCPFAGLGSELARSDEHTRHRAALGFEQVIALLSSHLEGQSSAQVRGHSMLAFCAMLGALTVSRIAHGEPLASEVLAEVGDHLVKAGLTTRSRARQAE